MRQAVVLVGGRGTRLGALAEGIPKPLLPIDGDKRFLDYLLENLARHGFRQIILLAGHLGEQVQARYEGMRISDCELIVVREPAPAGTGGALLCARHLLDQTFLMSNGDSYFDFNFLALIRALRPGDLGALALRRVDDARRYGVVEHASGRVLMFREKDPSLSGAAWISGGVYILRSEILDQLRAPLVSIETDVFPQAAAADRLACAGFGGYFIDIGLPHTLAQGRRELPEVQRRPAIFFGADNTLVSQESPPEHLLWNQGAVEAVRAANDAGWLAIVLAKPIAAANGSSDHASLGRRQACMQKRLIESGAHIDAFSEAPWSTGDIVNLPFDLSRSVLVSGDDGDLEHARAASFGILRYDGGDILRLVRTVLPAGPG